MSQNETKKIGLIIGRETDWPEAFITAVSERAPDIQAELVKIGGTFMDELCEYTVIIDRMSHEVPYYRTYVKFAAMQGTYIINDPFVWSADSRFFGTAMANKLGLKSPRTIALPNKDVDTDVVPDSFRNLVYPMDWEGIIDYVGVPAIFKEAESGGRRLSFRVHSVDELIQRYDESGTRTMILQELIKGGDHIHCYVIGMEKVLILNFLPGENRYLKGATSTLNQEQQEQITQSSRAISRAYGYDINMIEYLLTDDEIIVINATNPSPLIDRKLLSPLHFDWLINATAELAIDRVQRPLPQRTTFQIKELTEILTP
ncbi:MAG: hypothetical protein KDE48_15430 [Anaerolineales bacterium]|nr:hypothetical protein [Anaerolineales bacterium]